MPTIASDATKVRVLNQLRVLSEPNRFRLVLTMVKHGPQTVNELNRLTQGLLGGCSLSATSQHLNALEDVHLAICEPIGAKRFYEVRSSTVDVFIQNLRRVLEGEAGV